MDNERLMWVDALREAVEKYKNPWGKTLFDIEECPLCHVAEEVSEGRNNCKHCIFHNLKCDRHSSYKEAKEDYLNHMAKIQTPLEDLADDDNFELPFSFSKRAEELEGIADVLEYTVSDGLFGEWVDQYIHE